MRRSVLAVLALATTGVLVAGCGGGDDTAGGASIVFFGASSLEDATTPYAESFAAAEVKPSFAGSDQLAAQIRQGAAADVFASADTAYPAELHRDGLAYKPRVFAGNELVLVVAADSGISSLAGLARPGPDLVIGDPSVPVGAYTRTFLSRLPAGERAGIRANVRSEEPEVGSVLAKVEQGAADAGFVYAPAAPTAPDLRTVKLPAALRPDVAYSAVVLKASTQRQAANEFIDGLVSGEGAADLRRAGFLAPP